MAIITIDGEQYQVEDGQNLLNACLSLHKDLPYFCWHPAMGSVGACRQCAVMEYRDQQDDRGRLVMSCMTPVKDGGIYSINSENAREFRGGVIENLMTNHPHDCPVCEEGGECHLQDMTEMSGHTSRRFSGLKRTHRNQYLGPLINHEMNRCIGCYRCTRYYQDYAGGNDLQALGRNSQIYFGRIEDGMLENGFSGNLVEVCPTGVFTDKTFSAHFVRKWDLQTAPSVCEHCAVGCNTAPGSREDGQGNPQKLRRVVNLYHQEINGYFLCDRGRFGYDYVNNPNRIQTTLAADSAALIESTATHGKKIQTEVHPKDSVEKLADIVEQSICGKRRLIGVGSTRSSLENNFALRTLVGTENFYAGVSGTELRLLKLLDSIQRDPDIEAPTTPQIELADAVLILGEDISNTAPRIALAIRQAARNTQLQTAQQFGIPQWQDASVRQLGGPRTPIFVAAAENTGLDDVACDTLYASTEELAHFGTLVASILGGDQSPGLSGDQPSGHEFSETTVIQANKIAGILASAERPLIVCGSGLLSESLLLAAADIAKALNTQSTQKPESRRPHLYLACSDANSLGLTQLCEAEMSLQHLTDEIAAQPPLAGPEPSSPPRSIPKSLPVSLIILETDVYRHLPVQSAQQLLSSAEHIIQLDCLHNQTSAHADLLLPAAATPEYEGTFVNSSGLAQRFYAVYEGSGFIQESWRWLANVAEACGARAGGAEKIDRLKNLARWQHVSELGRALAMELPELQAVANLGPDENFRIEGLKVARQTHRASGRTALRADRAVAEQRPPQDADAPMNFSMEGIQFAGRTPLQANTWAPGWNSNQAIHKFQQGVAGERIGGSSGERIQRVARPLLSIPDTISDTPITPTAGEFTLAPLYRMFGSGELSVQAAGISTIVPAPFMQINPQDAQRLQLQSGDFVEIATNSTRQNYLVELSPFTPRGQLGLSAGFPCTEVPGQTSICSTQLQRLTDNQLEAEAEQ